MKNKKADKKKKVEKIVQYENLDKIGEIALFYGFAPHKGLEIKKIDQEKAKQFLEGDFLEEKDKKEKIPLHVEEKISLLRIYEEEKMNELPQPVMLYFKDSCKKHKIYADLEILNNSKSIAEATLIQTAKIILAEEGYKNIMIEINSIGDKDSMVKFTKEITNYYKKHLNDMHAECRQLFKKDPFDLLSCEEEKCMKINERAPKSINFLSEKSRIHFQEILEYLEALDIPYMINNSLVGNRKYCSETVFEIINMDYEEQKKTDKNAERRLAIGMRYDGLAKKIGYKKDLEGASLSILIEGKKEALRKPVKGFKKPFIYFIQLGFEAKLLSLKVIEELRAVNIPVFQCLQKDKLGAQVSLAEKTCAPYTMIIGKKEAVEKSVIIRKEETRSQDTVSIKDLGVYMKKLEI